MKEKEDHRNSPLTAAACYLSPHFEFEPKFIDSNIQDSNIQDSNTAPPPIINIASVSYLPADLLQLTDLVVEVVDTPLVLQAELREQICAQLGLQRLPGGLHGVEAGLQTLETALLKRKEKRYT